MMMSPTHYAAHAFWMRWHGYRLDDVFRHYHEFLETQWMSSDEARHRQWLRLGRLLTHAYQEVPYYREVFDRCGMTPRDVKSEADVRRIPVLTKTAVQEHRASLMARNYRGAALLSASSGGSTGQPTRLVLDPERKAAEVGDTWGYHDWAGWRPGDPLVRLWGSLDAPTFKRRAYRRLARIGINELRLNVHQMDAAAMDRFADMMTTFRPLLFVGYANAFFAVARHLVDRGHSLFGALGVVTTAEMLFPDQRRIIEQAFGCKVFNRYASQEIGQLAGECAHGNLHINHQNVYVEFEGATGPALDGRPGTTIVTDLHNYAMPFIRYQIGDLGVPIARRCACGRSMPVLGDVKGRVSDVIVTPAGHYIFADDIAEIFYPLEAIVQFQVIQERRDALTVKIVKGPDVHPTVDAYVLRRLREAVGEGMEVTLSTVRSIPVLPSGKHRICMSRVAQANRLTADVVGR